MTNSISTKGFFLVIIAAFFWSTLGISTRYLTQFGFDSFDLAVIRILGAGLCVMPLFIRELRQIKKFPLSLHLLLVGYAITGVILFYTIELISFQINPTGIAYVILYSAPVFVVLADTFFFKSKMTSSKIISLVLLIIGIILIIGLLGQISLSVIGLITALGSAFFYAAYTIYGKYFSEKGIDSSLVVYYIFTIASILILIFFPAQKITNSLPVSAIFLMIYMGIFPTAIAYLFYQKSLQFISISQAGITASIEPVFALLWGITILEENISMIQMIGIVCVVTSVILLKIRE